jgi:hypothetical protein
VTIAPIGTSPSTRTRSPAWHRPAPLHLIDARRARLVEWLNRPSTIMRIASAKDANRWPPAPNRSFAAWDLMLGLWIEVARSRSFPPV